ncbi:MAG: hypothetical protein GWN79_28740, partial [Actinobacteria bacterium]|nr:hypothetical protein [Actinomycetota bacterium]NIU22784.1 hypothetical protein [Actinomycetota bacterium]
MVVVEVVVLEVRPVDVVDPVAAASVLVVVTEVVVVVSSGEESSPHAASSEPAATIRQTRPTRTAGIRIAGRLVRDEWPTAS